MAILLFWSWLGKGGPFLDLKKYVLPEKEGILFRFLLTLTSTYTGCTISLFRDLNKVSILLANRKLLREWEGWR